MLFPDVLHRRILDYVLNRLHPVFLLIMFLVVDHVKRRTMLLEDFNTFILRLLASFGMILPMLKKGTDWPKIQFCLN